MLGNQALVIIASWLIGFVSMVDVMIALL